MSIPNYHWYVSINDGLLRSGGPLTISVVPVSYDIASGVKRPIEGSEDEIDLVLDPNSKPGGEMLVANAGYYASDGQRGNLVVHLRALTVPGSPDARIASTKRSETAKDILVNREQSFMTRLNTFVDGPAGRVTGMVIGASSMLSGLAAVTDGGFGALISGIGMLAFGGLILLGATSKEE